MQLDLSIIIVNYNVKYFLEQCLYAVVKACTGIDAEIIVVDNHSADGSREWLEGRFPSVIFKWNSTNAGFAKANNSVLEEARGEYILFLNPDTIVPGDCLQICLSFFKKHNDCGALGVRMIDGSGYFLRESKRGFPSPATSLFKMTGLATVFPTSPLFARYYAGHLPENETHEVDVIAGAFFMASKAVLQKLKGFDESFFMYGEDVDLSYRIQEAGYKNYYLADTSILHFKGESTQKTSTTYVKHFYGAMQLFVTKHYQNKKATLFFMRTAIQLGIILANIKSLAKKITGSRKGNKDNVECLVIADQERFNELLQLIKYASPPVLIKGRVATGNDDPYKPLGKFTELQQLIIEYRVRSLLFCEGELTFKQIIEAMQQLHGRATYLIHADHSNSIVGSNSKNEKGFFISHP